MKRLSCLTICLFCSCFLISLSTIAQQKKSEKEERISKDKMPEKAVLFLNDLLDKETRKPRFYFEIDGTRKSYEAKFKKASNLYSVEFGEEGDLQDIEITVNFDYISPSVKNAIITFFKKNYNRFNIEKVQLQYKKQTTENAQKTYNRAQQLDQNKPDNYEIVAKVKKNNQRKRLEILFDSSGNFKKQREIAESSYDYFMY